MFKSAGESYAGKYVPAFSYAIHQANLKHAAYLEAHPSFKPSPLTSEIHSKHSYESPAPYNVPHALPIPLAGLSIGDGSMDPITQIPGYGMLLFGLSMIDESQRLYFETVEGHIVELIKAGKYVEAFRLFDPLMMSDEYPYASTFTNFTGLTDYYNFKSSTHTHTRIHTHTKRLSSAVPPPPPP